MQFQFSVCMYGTCGRIDNKADFDFDYVENVSCGFFPVFLEGECVMVTGLSENQGKLLKCVIYPKYYKFILK